MKICKRCGVSKAYSDFHKSAKSKDGLHSYCKICNNRQRIEKYRNNITEEKVYRDGWRKRSQDECRAFIVDYLKRHPCVDCGNSDIRVLEFDHVGDKKYNIASMIGSTSVNRLREEVKKCVVRCANCHRIKTNIQFNFYRQEEI